MGVMGAHIPHPCRLSGMDEQQSTLGHLLRLVSGAAEVAVLRGGHATQAAETRAAVRAAFECAVGNGLIQLVPPSDYPDLVVLDPPYRLPGRS
jgi:hypothetical protein